ncbi:MAG TPA: ATPase domain-containing protein [Thermoplasmata archaeon]|jgi:KaiC/GvpD/RAD55 family RecA-like ATPase|nr:ATPase domain-containing protein [Thermoplasmata archaeon]
MIVRTGPERMVAPRTPTGIEGLDRLIQGGFPRGSVNLVAGPAGSGKTLFATQFAFNGAALFDEPAAYLALEENRESVERVMSGFGMDLEGLEDEGKFILVDLGAIRAGSSRDGIAVGLRELEDFLRSCIASTHVRRIVVDSISAVGLRYRSLPDLREEMFGFTRFLRDAGVTSLLITESPEGGRLTRFGVEQYLADSFLHLALEEMKGELRRTLTVRKMRFTKHDTGKHPVHITRDGLVVAEERVA